jgi:hypothetical protein
MRRRRQSGPVERNDDGTFSLNLGRYEVEVLLSFTDQLKQLINGDTDDPRVRRLFPVAYALDTDADAEYQKYMREELVTSRTAAVDAVTGLLTKDGPITSAELDVLMMTINGLRLVMGTLLDVSDDGAEPVFEDADDPLAAQWQLYGWLGWFLEWIVDAQSQD